MKLDLKVGPHWILEIVMGRIEEIVRFCIFFLAISWSGGTFGAPASEVSLSAAIAALQNSVIPSNDGDLLSASLVLQSDLAIQREKLLNQVAILVNLLSSSASNKLLNFPRIIAASVYDTPKNCAAAEQEIILLQNLISRLEALNQNNATQTVPTSSIPIQTAPTSSLPIISEATYASILNQRLAINNLIAVSVTPTVAQILQSLLDALYTTFIQITTGQISTDELPNLCSKTLALNNQLTATNAPTSVLDAVADFIKSLTLALTGQDQVTILALCSCLNDLETSVVTVIQNDKSENLQNLLSNLVQAVTNVILGGGDIGQNVIDIVQRYVASIKQALLQDGKDRAEKIYSSVLNFENELHRALLHSNSTVIVLPSPSQSTNSSNPGTVEEYIADIALLLSSVFGDSANLVRSAVEILLNIKSAQDSSSQVLPVSSDLSAILENLKKVDDFLKSISAQTDSTCVLERLVDLLIALPEAIKSRVFDALDAILEANSGTSSIDNAAAIVSNGQTFIIRETLVQTIYSDELTIEIIRSGTYSLVDPTTNVRYSGSFTVLDGTIQSDSAGTIYIESSGEYDVEPTTDDSSSQTAPKVKRRGKFSITDTVVSKTDNNGNAIAIENGTYILSDAITGQTSSGYFVVENTVSKSISDSSIELVKSGMLRVNGPDGTPPSGLPALEGDSGYFLFEDHLFGFVDDNGNIGNGIFNIKDPETDRYQTGIYTIENLLATENPDNSVDVTTTGKIFVTDGYNGVFGPDPYLIVLNGSNFKFVDHLVNTTDINGNVVTVRTGTLTESDPTQGIVVFGNYTTQNLIVTENPDGTTDTATFGRFFNIRAIASATASASPTNSSSNSTDSSTITSAQPLTIPKDYFDALVCSFNPADTQESESTSQTLKYDATSIIENGTTFVIDKFATPLLDTLGNIIGEDKQGTYYFVDSDRNVGWSGSFAIENSITKNIAPGVIQVTESGTYDVNPLEQDSDPTIEGQFSVQKNLIAAVDENGRRILRLEGTYTLIDPATGSSKSGNFVRINSASKSQPEGTIETIESGIFTVNNPASTSPIVGDDEYLVFIDHIFDAPDSNGNYGNGLFNIRKPSTNNDLSGNYVIEQRSTTKNADGSIDTRIEGTIQPDGVQCDPSSDGSPSLLNLISEAKFVINEHLTYVPNSYADVSLIGNGQYTQIDPETGEETRVDYVLLNVAKTDEFDGSINFIKYGIVSNEETSTDDLTDPVVPNTKSEIDILLSSLRPISSSNTSSTSTDAQDQTVQGKSGTTGQTDTASSTDTSTKQTTNTANTFVSPPRNPTQEPTDVPIDGASFILNEHIVPQLDSAGNVVGLQKTGTYSLMDPETQTSWCGNFEATNLSAQSVSQGVIDVTESGTFDVNLPDTTTQSQNEANFLIQERVSLVTDENGVSTATEAGNYSLTNPSTGRFTNGEFEVVNSISEANDDGSIDVIKSGKITIHEAGTTYPTENSHPTDYDGSFLFDVQIYNEPDSNGNAGIGAFNVKNATTNESVSGIYLIQNVTSTANSDGTVDSTISGTICLDSSSSNSSAANSDSAGAFTDKSQVTFTNHLTYVPDVIGHINVVGTGEFTSIQPETGVISTGTYDIQNYNETNNSDGSKNIIKSANFHYTTDDPIAIDSSSTSDDSSSSTNTLGATEYFHSLAAQASQTSSASKTEASQTSSASKTEASQTSSASTTGTNQSSSTSTTTTGQTSPTSTTKTSQTSSASTTGTNQSSATSTTTTCQTSPTLTTKTSQTSSASTTGTNQSSSISTTETSQSSSASSSSSNGASKTSGSTSTSPSNSGITSYYVNLPRSNVIAAIDGQSLESQDAVVVRFDSGDILIADSIDDSDGSITFRVANLADVVSAFTTKNRVWSVTENDFSEQDRSLFDALLQAANPPCDS